MQKNRELEFLYWRGVNENLLINLRTIWSKDKKKWWSDVGVAEDELVVDAVELFNLFG